MYVCSAITIRVSLTNRPAGVLGWCHWIFFSNCGGASVLLSVLQPLPHTLPVQVGADCIYVIRIHHGMANDGTPQYSQLSEPAVHPFHSGMGGASRPREPRRRRRGGEYLNIRPFNYQLSAQWNSRTISHLCRPLFAFARVTWSVTR